MPTKVFTLMGGKCPFGKGCDIDTESCRKCEWYYRAGTGTFFWCRHPIERPQDDFRDATKMVQQKRKRGRPPGKAAKKPVKRTKKKKQ